MQFNPKALPSEKVLSSVEDALIEEGRIVPDVLTVAPMPAEPLRIITMVPTPTLDPVICCEALIPGERTAF